MSRTRSTLYTCAAVAALALATPNAANAAERIRLGCNVAVTYAFNGTVQETYAKDFVVEGGVAFSDDFSTSLRQKSFTANAVREASSVVVTIDYFNDVGVFHSVGLTGRLAMNGQNQASTSGTNFFSTSLGVAGNHSTDYTLVCRRI